MKDSYFDMYEYGAPSTPDYEGFLKAVRDTLIKKCSLNSVV
jgi:hypothetical protein